MRRFTPALILSLIVGSAVGAQPTSSAKNVVLEIFRARTAIPAGHELKIALRLTIAHDWHLNSHTPTFDYLIPTDFEILPREGVIVTDIQFPKGEKQKFEFAEQPIDVYSGTVTIFASLRLSSRFSPGTDTLLAKLRVQSCNDHVCLAPSTISVSIPVVVAGTGTEGGEINSELFSSYSPTVASSTELQNDFADAFRNKGSVLAYLAIFLVGLALNLTPCVYPMLSVTVSLFGTQTETHATRVFVKAIVYVLGIATMYSTLGVSAALGGGLFGSWLQSPWVLGGIAALLFGLALSSFGLYQIAIPYWLTSKLGGQEGSGFIATYLSGLVVGVFAAPCVGPPVIALLTYVSAKGDPLLGFQIFFALSLGLGFPYLILGTFSGLLKKIPRSGTWLVWVEHIFGVILVGASCFYLSLAVAPKLAAYIVPAAAILGGSYLGFLDPTGREKKFLNRIQWMFGVLCIALGMYFASALTEHGLVWEPYSEQALAEAKAKSQPVMMDFYADWCIPCLELDRKTFVEAAVKDATMKFRRFKVDLTHFDSEESEALRKRFSISGVPTIVFLSAEGIEQQSARVVGFLPSAEFVAKALSAQRIQ
jgi:thiol:disulfide interchange protein DsbD